MYIYIYMSIYANLRSEDDARANESHGRHPEKQGHFVKGTSKEQMDNMHTGVGGWF